MTDIAVRRIAVRRLDEESLGDSGSIVTPGSVTDESLNRAPGQMAFLWVHQFLDFPAKPYIASSRYYFRGARCEYLQRHPESTLVLLPLGATPSVIFVAGDAGGEPDLSVARAILLDGKRGVVLNPGVWVRYAYPIGEYADFAYVSSRVDPRDDIEHVYLEERFGTILEWYFGPPEQDGVTFSTGGAVLGLPERLPPGTRLGPLGSIIREDSQELD
jgi:ureidoglycolate hydrolase